MAEAVKPLDRIRVIGKRGEDQPFQIRKHRGFYFYISTEVFDRLKEINDAYRTMYQEGVQPLEIIRIVGRGGLVGYMPFGLAGQEGRYLCIPAEDLRRLEEINRAYGPLFELEEKKQRALGSMEDARRAVGDAKDAGAQDFAPEPIRNADWFLGEMEASFNASKFDRAIELAAKTVGVAREAKAETLRKIEEVERELEEKRKKTKKLMAEIKKEIEYAYDAGASEYSPELLKRAVESLAEIETAFNAARYDEAMEMAPEAKSLAEDAKADAVWKIEKSKKEKVEELEKPKIEKLKVPEVEELEKKAEKLEKPPEKPKLLGGKYVYCIISSDGKETSFGNIGIGNGGGVYSVPYRDVAAVVSDSPLEEYELSEENMRIHEGVVNTVMEKYSAVPAAFDQVFKNQKILRAIMRRAYPTLKKCTDLVNNRVELGVKAIMGKEMAESLEGKREEFVKRCASDIFESLNKIAAQSVEGRLFSKRLVLNASFLVDRDKIEEFSKKVESLGKKYKKLTLKYSGPWPPYTFVYIRIGAKGVEVGRREVM